LKDNRKGKVNHARGIFGKSAEETKTTENHNEEKAGCHSGEKEDNHKTTTANGSRLCSTSPTSNPSPCDG